MENNVQFVNTGRRYVKRTVDSKISQYLKKQKEGFVRRKKQKNQRNTMTKNKNMFCKTALNFPDHLIMY